MTPYNRCGKTRRSVEVAEIYYEGNFVREGRIPVWEQTRQAELEPLIASVRTDSSSANGTVQARYNGSQVGGALVEQRED